MYVYPLPSKFALVERRVANERTMTAAKRTEARITIGGSIKEECASAQREMMRR